jgi:hypothetical protein
MPQESSKTSPVGYVVRVLCLILIGSIIIGSIGVLHYIKEKHSQSNCKPTMCFVQNYLLVGSKCPTQQCKPTGIIQPCTTVYYTCDLDTYVVIYNVSDGRQIRSTTTAKDGPGSKSVRIY